MQGPVQNTITIASWNIEKNGQSSTPCKQGKVSEFIDRCVGNHAGALNIDVAFLCEVHSARLTDYIDFLRGAYGEHYFVRSFPGGNSNAYVLLYKRTLDLKLGRWPLKGLNRDLVMLGMGKISVVLAHFKSGQTNLTVSQLEAAAGFLEEAGGPAGKWAITGDMNFDFNKFNQLHVPPGTKACTCWTDQTQAKGGILDWCMAGGNTNVKAEPVASLFKPEICDMKGPDHRPVIFTIS